MAYAHVLLYVIGPDIILVHLQDGIFPALGARACLKGSNVDFAIGYILIDLHLNGASSDILVAVPAITIFIG